ncbi:hypothetical protein DV515_00007739, partial [Chloebia gouldiae]
GSHIRQPKGRAPALLRVGLGELWAETDSSSSPAPLQGLRGVQQPPGEGYAWRKMSYGGAETSVYPVCNHRGQDQGSTLQLSTLSGNSKSAVLLEVRRNLNTMQYSPVAVNPSMDKGPGIPQSPGEGTKAAACSDSGAGWARSTECFQSQYLTKTSTQGQVYNFLERPSGWKCFIYHFA